jgi:hypothetical protein
MTALLLVLLAGVLVRGHAHQDPCHRRHACPSDQVTDVCGDRGRCDQCPDNQLCLAGKPRAASAPMPAPSSPVPSEGFAQKALILGDFLDKLQNFWAKLLGPQGHPRLTRWKETFALFPTFARCKAEVPMRILV